MRGVQVGGGLVLKIVGLKIVGLLVLFYALVSGGGWGVEGKCFVLNRYLSFEVQFV